MMKDSQNASKGFTDWELFGYNDTPMFLILSNIIGMKQYKILHINTQYTSLLLSGVPELFGIGPPLSVSFLSMYHIKPSPLKN